jgi:hypothetical protein
MEFFMKKLLLLIGLISLTAFPSLPTQQPRNYQSPLSWGLGTAGLIGIGITAWHYIQKRNELRPQKESVQAEQIKISAMEKGIKEGNQTAIINNQSTPTFWKYWETPGMNSQTTFRDDAADIAKEHNKTYINLFATAWKRNPEENMTRSLLVSSEPGYNQDCRVNGIAGQHFSARRILTGIKKTEMAIEKELASITAKETRNKRWLLAGTLIGGASIVTGIAIGLNARKK